MPRRARPIRLLMPDLDPELVRRVLGRTTYRAVEEAELIASLIWQKAGRSGEHPETGVLADRLGKAFDWPRRGNT
jgi:hypothetical protein